MKILVIDKDGSRKEMLKLSYKAINEESVEFVSTFQDASWILSEMSLEELGALEAVIIGNVAPIDQIEGFIEELKGPALAVAILIMANENLSEHQIMRYFSLGVVEITTSPAESYSFRKTFSDFNSIVASLAR